MTKNNRSVATLLEIIAFLAAIQLYRQKGIRAYCRAALKVMETVLLAARGLPPRNHTGVHAHQRFSPSHYPVLIGEPLTRMTPEMAQKYVALRVAGLRPNTAEYDSAYESAYADLHWAGSLFQPKLMAIYCPHFNVPSMDGFRAAAYKRRGQRQMALPTDNRLKEVHCGDLPALEARGENVYLPALLSVKAGLTRDETIASHSSWLCGNEQRPFLRVDHDGSVREIPILPSLYTRLFARGEGYFLDGGPSRRLRHCSAAAQALKERGSAGVGWPLAEYRDFFGFYVASAMPALVAMEVLGHRWFGTTQQFRACGKLSPEMIALWDLPVPPPPAIVRPPSPK